MNKSLQIALLAVILGIAFSATAVTDISSITPTTAKVGVETEITFTINTGVTLPKDEILSFSIDDTKAGTGKLAFKLAGSETGTLKQKYTFDKAGTYKCLISTAADVIVIQKDIVIEVAGKFLSASMVLGALFLLF